MKNWDEENTLKNWWNWAITDNVKVTACIGLALIVLVAELIYLG